MAARTAQQQRLTILADRRPVNAEKAAPLQHEEQRQIEKMPPEKGPIVQRRARKIAVGETLFPVGDQNFKSRPVV